MNQKSWAGMLMAASVMVWLAWETRAVGQSGGGSAGFGGSADTGSGGNARRPKGAGAGGMQRQGGGPVGGMGMGMPGMGGGAMMGAGGGAGIAGGAPFDPLMQQDLALDAQIREAIESLSSADEADLEQPREAIRQKVAELLDQQFEIRQQRRERDIEEIEKRVQRLREAFDKRAAAKEKIIERRLNDLFSDADGLGWGDAGGGEAKDWPTGRGFPSSFGGTAGMSGSGRP